MNDNDLDEPLKKWDLDLPGDPQFHSSVWREIAKRESISPGNRFRESLDCLLTPRLAIPAAAVAVVAVMLTAIFHGELSRERIWSSLATAYISAIDPVAHTDMMTTLDSER